jgi:hypothetical protein
VLFIVTFIDATVHQFYFFWTGRYLMTIGIPGNWVMPAMSVGQFAEIGTMAVLGAFLKRLGWRWTMTIGILGHAARFAVFALLPLPVPAVIVQVLHGICYAFFFATVYIFVDEFFPKDVRSSAQGLFNLLILGIGPLVGNYVGPLVGDAFETAKVAIAVENPSGQEDVVVRGQLKNPRTDSRLEKLTIQEPDKEPYERLVKLDGDDKFDLTLQKPRAGSYSVTAHTRRKRWLTGDQDFELKTPDLVIAPPSGEAASNNSPVNLPKVQVTDIDFQRLFLLPSLTAVFGALLLLAFFRPPLRAEAEAEERAALAD